MEDEFLVSLDIAATLEMAGFDVVGPAARLAEALALARSEAALAIAVLDVNLAGEKSWPIARMLKEREIPYLFTTGYLEAHAQLPADLAGALVLAKPVETHVFVSAVRQVARPY